MFRLRSWHLELLAKGPVGFGECYNNPKFSNGFRIHTSTVMKIEADPEKKSLKLFTYSGSCYEADLADISEYGAEHTREVFRDKSVPFKIEECFALRKQRREEKEKQLLEVLHPGWLHVEMAGSYTLCGAWFMEREEELIPIPVSQHVSLFSTDSFLVTDWMTGLCDWRIFSEDAAVIPYHWSDGLEAVCLENRGDSFVFRGTDRDIVCEGGRTTLIKSGDYTGEGLISPDVVSGKSVLKL